MATMFLNYVIIFGSLGIGLFVIMFMYYANNSHRLILRDPTNRTQYLAAIWVMEKKDKQNGTLVWKSVPLSKKKIEVPKPPEKAIDIGTKGRKYAEAYVLSEDELVWIEDKGIMIKEEEVIDNLGKKKKVKKIYNIEKDGKLTLVDSFQPFSVVQRDVLINQFKKAEEISRQRWTPERIIAMTAIFAFVVIILALFIFWKDLAQPALNSHALALEAQQQNIELVHKVTILAQALGVKIDSNNTATTPATKTASKVIVSNTEDPAKINLPFGLNIN